MRPDGFGRFRKAGGDSFAMRLQRFDGHGAARLDPSGDGVGVGADRVPRQIRKIGKPRRDGFAARADQFEHLIVARVNAPDDRVGVGVDRGPRRVRRVRELRRDGVSFRAHGFDGRREAGGDGVAVAPQRRHGVGVARVDSGHDVVGVGVHGICGPICGVGKLRRDDLAVGAEGVHDLVIGRQDASDDRVGVRADGFVRAVRGGRESPRDGVAVRAEIASRTCPWLSLMRPTTSSA